MDSQEQSTIRVVKKYSPAVVSVIASKFASQIKKDNPFEPTLQGVVPPDFGGPTLDVGKNQRVTVGGGSGFLVRKDGLILTNKHVVFDAQADFIVSLSDDKKYPAQVLTRDPVNDIAILKIKATNLPTIPLGTTAQVQPGQTVIAIGNALGLFSNTVSKGVVSGLSRQISAALGEGPQQEMERLRGVIQTDVAINQGNSGGPLLNLAGEVIGINTAVIFGAQNIGFAIPIERAHKDLTDLEKFGRIIQPYIGIRYVMLSPEIKERYSLASDKGALVIQDHIPGSHAVAPHSPADRAGIKQHDIILAINDETLDEKSDFSEVIQKHDVGDLISLTTLRSGKKQKINVRLTERK